MPPRGVENSAWLPAKRLNAAALVAGFALFLSVGGGFAEKALVLYGFLNVIEYPTYYTRTVALAARRKRYDEI